jgi:predicted short-subunit dehydrogenase-like oxidoreductase (DUF2520 family)
MAKYNISFAGAGRVASALCMELIAAGHTIDIIVAGSEKSSRSLAGRCNSKWSTTLDFPESSDLIIVSVPDHKLPEVLKGITCGKKTVVVHTAGSIGLNVFPDTLPLTGVLYPLQTFSKERKVSFNGLPFFIESPSEESLSMLENVVASIDGRSFKVDSEHRILLHLAAVFTCNFTNHMLTAGNDIAAKAGFRFDVLMPLLSETIQKAIELGPEKSQTGPALRNDINTIEKHLDLLSFSPEFQSVYREVTRSIAGYYKKS